MSLKNIKIIIKIKIKLTIALEIMDNIRLINFFFSFKVNKNCEKKIIKLYQLAYIQKI